MNLLIHGLLLTISSSLYAALSKIIIVVYYKLPGTCRSGGFPVFSLPEMGSNLAVKVRYTLGSRKC